MEPDRHLVAVDMVVFRKNGDDMDVLMIVRKNPPYQNYLALPGGFVNDGERTKTAALRETAEETGLVLPSYGAALVGVFDAPKRDSRGHVIGLAFWSCLDDQEEVIIQGADDAAEAKWVTMTEIRKLSLAFDHKNIIYRAFDCYRDGQTL